MNGTLNRRPTLGDHAPGDVAVQERPAGPATPVDLEEFEKFFREQFSTPVAPAGAQAAPAKPAVEDPLMAELARIVGQEVRPSIAAASPPVMPKASDPFASAPSPASPDPLKAFEEELRRFDAEREAARLAATPPAPVLPELRGAQPDMVADPRRVELEQALQPVAAPAEALPQPDLPGDSLAVEPPPLEDMTEAQPRSKKVMAMLGLAGAIALTGVVGTLGFAGRTKPTGGDAPVIVAKPGPTKEKPADPGGVEISGQDRQVLARGQNEPKAPAAVVNKEEQPVDLNQTPKREAARVVMPPSSGQTAAPILMPSGSQPPAAPAGDAQPASPAAGLEPKRVRSVRVSGEGETAPQPTRPATSAPAPAPAAQRPPSMAAAPPPATTAPAAPPPKTEARPTTAVRTIPTTPGTTPQPARPATPQRPAPAPAAPAAEAEDGEAPISLRPPSGTRAAPTPTRTASTSGAASGGSGGFAVQLKSSPSEADARSAANSFKQRHADALGGQTIGVRQAVVDGKTVYRVRVSGLSRENANSLCGRIKADGGTCFVAGN